MKIDFLIVGAQKSGTTALHNILNSHPEIYAPYELKDKIIFNKDSSLNHNQISNFKSYLLASNVNYCRDISALKLAKKNNPNVKIIFIYRDPVERIFSAYKYAMERSLISKKDNLIKLLNNSKEDSSFLNNQLSFLESTKYGNILKNICSIFDNKQIIVCCYEFFKNNPEKFLITLQNRLNLSKIENLKNERVNVTKGGFYFKFINDILFNRKNFIRKVLSSIINKTGIVKKKKLRDHIRKLNQKKSTNFKLSTEEKKLIIDKLRNDQDIFHSILSALPKNSKVL